MTLRDIIALAYMRNLVNGGLVGDIRRNAGVTQAEVASAVGVADSTVAYWERGHVPTGAPALRYARLLRTLESVTRR